MSRAAVSRSWRLMLACALVACGSAGSDSTGRQTSAALGKGAVARVGGENIAGLTVARIADAQDIPVEQARARAIDDALLASGARERLPSATALEKRVLAQALMRQLWLDTSVKPVTEAELAEATEVRWTHWDRPPGWRTVHTVVMVEEGAPEEESARARAHAEKLLAAVQSVAEQARLSTPPERDERQMFSKGSVEYPIERAFIDVVDAVDAAGFTVKPQSLHPITHDGRPIDHNLPLVVSYYDERYAAASAALQNRGDLTPVFRSYAGWHVAMLVERTPERRATRQERLAGLRDEIIRVRAKRARAALLQRLRGSTKVSIPHQADSRLAQVRFSDD